MQVGRKRSFLNDTVSSDEIFNLVATSNGLVDTVGKIQWQIYTPTKTSQSRIITTSNSIVKNNPYSIYFQSDSKSSNSTPDFIWLKPDERLNAIGDFTVECWARWFSTSGGSLICFSPTNLEKFIPAGNSCCYDNGTRSGSIWGGVIGIASSQFGWYSGGNLFTRISASVNTWHHVAVVKRSDGNLKLFFNGNKVYEGSRPTFTLNAGYNGLCFGINMSTMYGSSYPSLHEYFAGYVDSITISDIAKYSENFIPV